MSIRKTKKAKIASSTPVQHLAPQPHTKSLRLPPLPHPRELIKPYVIAIPTYKRPELIARATLWTLFAARIPATIISLFLANANERRNYISLLQNPIASNGRLAALLPKHVSDNIISKYAKWLLAVNIIVGYKGLANQRNFIRSWYPPTQPILSMDDDVRKVMRLKVSATNPRDRSNWQLVSVGAGLDELVQSAFRKTQDAGGYLWGVYPVDNAYFMLPNSSQQLRFIVGPMFGIINRPELADQLDITMDEKEDMERTLKHWALDGVVIRLNYITIQTAYFNNTGGMQASLDTPLEYRNKAAEKAATHLHNMFPQLTTIYQRKGGPRKGWTEIRLVRDRLAKKTQKNPSSYVANSNNDHESFSNNTYLSRQ